MRRVRWARVAITGALFVTMGAASGCSAGDDAAQSAALAAAAVARWDDPAVQERWGTALVGPSPLIDTSYNLPVEQVLASLREGLVKVSPSISDTRSPGVVDYATASDQEVLTLGARATLGALAVGRPTDTCWNDAPCKEVVVTAATLTTMGAPTARGTASVPAWSYAVDGLADPLVLAAVPVARPEDVEPAHSGFSSSWLLDRDGSTLRVSMVMPDCGARPNERHLLETDAAIAVWVTAKRSDRECTSPVRGEATFTLRAPIGNRPVIDEAGRLLLSPQSVSLPGQSPQPCPLPVQKVDGTVICTRPQASLTEVAP